MTKGERGLQGIGEGGDGGRRGGVLIGSAGRIVRGPGEGGRKPRVPPKVQNEEHNITSQ